MEEMESQQMPVDDKPKRNSQWIIGGIFIACIVTVIIYFTQATDNAVQSILPKGKENSLIPSATPTPLPFAEITIPYLRERSYESELGERSVQYQGANYTAYLTSYNSDGYQVNGLLTIPTEEEPKNGFPAIVFIHGYIPPSQYQTAQQYYDYVDYLASSGYVVFKIDLRGHGNSEGTPGGGYYSADYVIDVLNARAALQESDFVNPDKVGLWGHSMAGNVTLRAMAVKPEIRAGVVWAGAVYTYEDMQKYGIQDSSYQRPPQDSQRTQTRQRMRDIHGEPDLSKPFWQQMAPVTYLSDFQGAVQLNHAVNDDVVNIGYSRDLADYLDNANVPYEIHEYQSGGHNISPPDFNEAMVNTVSFYDKHLK